MRPPLPAAPNDQTVGRSRTLGFMSAATSTLPAFEPRDPLALDALLDDEERLIRDTVRQYVREKFLPHIAEHFEAGAVPEHLAKDPRQPGPPGVPPHGHGWAGAAATAQGAPRPVVVGGGARPGAFFS